MSVHKRDAGVIGRLDRTPASCHRISDVIDYTRLVLVLMEIGLVGE